MHNTFGGTIAAISVLASVGARKETDAEARHTLQNIGSMANEARQEIRSLLNQLSHPHATERQWLGECRKMAEAMALAAELQLEWKADDREHELMGDSLAALSLKRALKEALTNIARHAQASRVEISSHFRGSRLEIAVRDDGRGIPADHVQGRGLPNIRARVLELGGEILISNDPGAHVRFAVPLPLAFTADLEHIKTPG